MFHLMGAVPTTIFSPAASPARAIFGLSILTLSIVSTIFLIVGGLLLYALIKYRERPGQEEREPAQLYGSNQIEISWTVIPILIVIVLFLATARVIIATERQRPPASALHVTVVGHQFWWEFRYPGTDVVTANELHIPTSSKPEERPTFLSMISADTDHSFWVPKLAGKMDVIPNKINVMWFDPDQPGLYLGQCSQYCGAQHAKMLIPRVCAGTGRLRSLAGGAGIARAAGPHHGRRARRLRAERVHELPSHSRHGGGWPVRPGPHPLRQPRHLCVRRGDQHAGSSGAVDQRPGALQGRSIDAGNAPVGQRHCIGDEVS